MSDEQVHEVGRKIDSLPCPLTDAEALQAGEDLAQAMQNIQQEEILQKDGKAEMKARLAELEGERAKLVRKVTRREEYRATETVLHLYPNGMVHIVRCDTGEEIHQRAAFESELQKVLPLDETDGEG